MRLVNKSTIIGRKPGRPSIAEEDRKRHRVSCVVSKSENDEIEKAARERAGLTVSEWARAVLLEAARKP